MTSGSEQALRGTPYLTHGDPASEVRFAKVRERAAEVQQRALTAQERISTEAAELLDRTWLLSGAILWPRVTVLKDTSGRPPRSAN